MLVTANALNITKGYELTERQAQALVDLEATIADMGLMMWLVCNVCRMIGDPADCEGNAEPHQDGTMTFSVKCNCTKRAFRGTLKAPKPPRPLRQPRVDLTVKPEVEITRPQMLVFKDASDVLHQLRMQYALRCLACRNENRDSDGIRGAAESNANYFVLDCDCTKRVYRGSDAPLVQ